MNNFGVFEIAGAKTTAAPGWAYVPDNSVHASASLQPANRKRARNATGPSIGNLTARQEAKIRKEVEALERDWGKDNGIPVPVRPGSRAQGKSTANVRKILQSQKTFANHLDDFLAMQQSEAGSGAAAATTNNKRPATNTGAGRNINAGNDEDSHMMDVDDSKRLPPVLEPFHGTVTADDDAPTAPLPGDNDPLLVSRVPDPPSDAELRQLLDHPPLMYLEARGTFETTGKPAKRVFCEICGYWGRVRCMKCGTRVCALDCLETHREECVTRYGL